MSILIAKIIEEEGEGLKDKNESQVVVVFFKKLHL